MDRNLLFLAILLLPNIAEAQQLNCHRLFVVDCSNSMSGRRIEEVRKEILDQLTAQPVTKQSSVSFILFSDTPETAVRFTDDQKAKDFVDQQLIIRGGTEIGKALSAAITELKQFKDSKVLVLNVYTDDEDGNRQPIKAAETQLLKLFDRRHQEGLAQAVFLRRWSTGGGLGDLANRIRSDKPHIRILDTNSAIPAIKPPSIQLKSAKVSSGQILEATFDFKFDESHLPAYFESPGIAIGNKLSKQSWKLQPGEQKSVTLKIPLDSKAVDAENVTVDFDLKLLETDKPILATFPTRNLSIDVPFRATATCNIRAVLRPTKNVYWHPVETAKIIFECELHIELTHQDGVFDPTEIKWDGLAGCELSGGNSKTYFKKQGRKAIKILLEQSPTDDELRAGRSNQKLNVELEVDPSSSNHFPKKKLLVVAKSHPDFPPATTTIDVKVSSVGQQLWHQLPDRIWSNVKLEINVNGPLPGKDITLKRSSNVTKFKLTPNEISTGSQTINLEMICSVQPQSKTTKLIFAIIPPPATSNVRIVCTKQIEIELPRPDPVNIVVVQQDDSVSIWPQSNTAQIRFQLTAEGPCTPQFFQSLSIVDIEREGVPLNEDLRRKYKLPNTTPATYLFGKREQLELNFEERSGLVAVKPATLVVEIRQFGKVLVHVIWFCAALIALAVLVLIWVLFKPTHLRVTKKYDGTFSSESLGLKLD